MLGSLLCLLTGFTTRRRTIKQLEDPFLQLIDSSLTITAGSFLQDIGLIAMVSPQISRLKELEAEVPCLKELEVEVSRLKEFIRFHKLDHDMGIQVPCMD
jgi:hypothetical protein